MTLASLVKSLADDDINIKLPAAQAISSLLSMNSEEIVDRLLF
jgi:hypothetical protein